MLLAKGSCSQTAPDGAQRWPPDWKVVCGTSRTTAVAMLCILRGSLLALYPKQGHGRRRTRCGHWQMVSRGAPRSLDGAGYMTSVPDGLLINTRPYGNTQGNLDWKVWNMNIPLTALAFLVFIKKTPTPSHCHSVTLSVFGPGATILLLNKISL